MKKSSYLLLAGALTGASLNAYANGASYSVSAPTLFDAENALVPTLSFDKFNASLGTLTSVEIDLYTTFSGSLNVENKGSKAATLNLSATESVDVGNAILGTLVSGSNSSSSVTFNLAKYDGHVDYAGTSGASSSFSLPTSTNSASYSIGSILSAFTGTGQMSLDATATSGAIALGTGNFSRSVPTDIDVGLKVTYNYVPAPVPEPETYAMLLAGLGLVGAVARKRKAK